MLKEYSLDILQSMNIKHNDEYKKILLYNLLAINSLDRCYILYFIFKRKGNFTSCTLTKKETKKETVNETINVKSICEYCKLYKYKHQLKKCGRCKLVSYCSVACQKRDWNNPNELNDDNYHKNHKKLCLAVTSFNITNAVENID